MFRRRFLMKKGCLVLVLMALVFNCHEQESVFLGSEDSSGALKLWMGMEIKSTADSSVEGVLVKEVFPGSPADDAGIKEGDIIIRVNYKNVKDIFELFLFISENPHEKDYFLKLLRYPGELAVFVYNKDYKKYKYGLTEAQQDELQASEETDNED